MEKKPNIIVLLLDAARLDKFSCYGYDRETTPNIDRLSRNGTIYENAHSQSIWSLPAYTSIFTGEYPSDHGSVDWGQKVDTNPLVESLNGLGYTTLCSSPHLMSGDFGLTDAFQKHEWTSDDGTGSMWDMDPVMEKLRIEGQKGNIDSTTDLIRQGTYHMAKERSLQTIPNGLQWLYLKLLDRFGYWGDDSGRETIETAKDMISNSDSPYFLFCNFTEPHYEYRPPRDHIYDFIDSDISIKQINQALEMDEIQATVGTQQIGKGQREILIALADACLKYTDELVGELLDSVDLENTLVITLSDHGDLHGEWDTWGHQRRVHQYLSHVPLIINYPWESPKRVIEPVELRSLNKLIEQVASGKDDILEVSEYAISEYHGWDTQLFIDPFEEYDDVSENDSRAYQVSCATSDWYLFLDSDGGTELYDLESDPDLLNDVSQENPDVVETLRSNIETSVGQPEENKRNYRGQSNVQEMDRVDGEIRERLDDLGYM